VSVRYYLIGRAGVDLNANGIPDAREIFVNGADPQKVLPGIAADASATPQSVLQDNEASALSQTSGSAGESNAVAVVRRPWVPGRIVYVDAMIGNDINCGRAPVQVSQEDRIGPKKTIAAGLAAAKPGDTVIIKSGHYGEDLNVAGRDISVRIRGTVDLSGKRRRTVQEEASEPVIAPAITNSPSAM